MISRNIIISLVVIFLGMLLNGCGSAASEGGSNEESKRIPAAMLVSLSGADGESLAGIQLFPHFSQTSAWTVYRLWPHGGNAIYQRRPNSGNVVVPAERIRGLLPRSIIEFNGDLYIIAYNPSKYYSNGIASVEIWKVDALTGLISQTADNLSIGGIEDHIHAKVVTGRIDVCDSYACISVDWSGKTVEWEGARDLQAARILEAVFVEGGVFLLLRTDLAAAKSGIAPYRIKFVPRPNSKIPAQTVASFSDCIPFNLGVEGAGATWSCARTVKELADLLRFDLRRLPHGGVNDLGLNNHDGRIAWSQVYTIGALIHVSEKYTPKIWRAADWAEYKALAAQGIDLIIQHGRSNFAGYYSTRYSINRQPLLFAVHLGRIAAVLSDARADGYISEELDAMISSIHSELISTANTVETLDLVGGFSTLRFRKGAAFWADGVNTPYNFLSGYVTGLLSSRIITAADRNLAMRMLTPIMDLESPSRSPLWHYWWGQGKIGWTADVQVSLNTPNYSGNNSIADISYRSMDASAILQLAKVDPGAVQQDLVEAIGNYVAVGDLLPSVNLYLIRNDRSVVIDEKAALSYARSASPWEVANQVFALESLATKWLR